MKWLNNYLEKHKSIQTFIRQDKKLASLNIVQESLLLYGTYLQTKQPLFVVVENETQVYDLANALQNLDESLRIYTYTHEESLRIEAITASDLLRSNRINTLHALINQSYDICITHSHAALRKISPKQTLANSILKLEVGQEISMDALALKLHNLGYSRVKYVEKPFTYAMRGGICDVFSSHVENPIRIEFFDIEIESIRSFDIDTQRSIESFTDTQILFAQEVILSLEDKISLSDQIDKDLEDKDIALVQEVKMQINLLESGYYEDSLYPYLAYFNNYETIVDYIESATKIILSIENVERTFNQYLEDITEFIMERYEAHLLLNNTQLYPDFRYLTKDKPLLTYTYEGEVSLDWHPANIVSTDLGQLLRVIKKEAVDHRVILSLPEKEIESFINTLIDRAIAYKIFSGQTEPGIFIQVSNLNFGFILDDIKTLVYTNKELFQENRRIYRFDDKFNKAEHLNQIGDLDTFDYVVHRQYGIGKYMGITTKLFDNHQKDFMRILYRDNDELFVPLEQFNLVRKYISSEAVSVRLSKLGSGAWKRNQDRIRESVNDVAERLIELYKERSLAKGHAFSKDTPYQVQFEKEFPYDLTHDQVIAVKEIKEDMESTAPMDRLLIGDVGFGKTEVAIRAAFKAIVDEKQVMFLCPTTILSSQHYETFSERFKNYPIKIEVLNRFVSPAKQKTIVERFRKGDVDILIGTHRILSKDVIHHDLGLLIIDEEQRFGVEHKEKIKEIKVNIDVLSLSATPIPRTLQMSLIGIRSLSQLNTPPKDRLPVMTYVIEKNERTVYDVIQKELNRNGQAFYLYNNVERIYAVASSIASNVDKAKVGVVHGQMDRDAIEDVMFRFVHKEINVLVCTTIIETGIDIPNANTILIDNAHTFGLSQLYQIKGRVGRSNRLAYAYFLVPSKKSLTEVAQKRLQAIKEFTHLGSGYKIAMRDLTIRGAGELLGGNQSGFIESVGIELYIELLKEALDLKQGKPVKEARQPFNLKVDGYLPQRFTSDDGEKLEIYQEINEIQTIAQLKAFNTNLEDRYGKLPNTVAMLLEKKRLEIFLLDDRIDVFKEYKDRIELSFTPEFSNNVDGTHLFEIVSNRSYDIKIKYVNKKIVLTFLVNETWIEDLIYILENIKEKTP